MKLIIGASSGLGLKLAFLLAFKGFDLILCSSNIEDLKKIRSHIKNVYGVRVYLIKLNLSDIDKVFKVYLEDFRKFIPKVTGAYFIAGKTENNDPELYWQKFEDITNINFTSTAFIFSQIIKELPINSFIIFASSVACIRSRGSNTTYASAKKALEFYIKGIKHKNPERAKYIKIVRFGYIDTRMTYGQSLMLPKVSTLKAAEYVYGIRKNSPFISYFPKWWKIFNLLKIIPFSIFRYLRF